MSFGSGFLFLNGLQPTVLQINTSFLMFSPAFSITSSRTSPASPTKGIPSKSSVAPGASPIAIIFAQG
jgi:hypothetical protein